MTDYGIFAIIPAVLVIFLALKTKDVILSLAVAVFAGVLIYAKGNPYVAFVALWKDFCFKQLTASWNAELMLLMAIIGGFTAIMERSGGFTSFSTIVTKVINSRTKAQLITWCGGIVIFFSDSANCLILGPTFRPITDRLKISREKLAYIVDSTASPIGMLIPITTWAVLVGGFAENAMKQIGMEASALTIYAQTIPHQFYTILAILFIPLIVITRKDFGPMVDAENRAIHQNKRHSTSFNNTINGEGIVQRKNKNARASVVVIPMVVLFGVIAAMFLSFGFPSPMEGIDMRVSLATAYLLAAVTCMILTTKYKIMTFKETLQTVMGGVQKMSYMLVVLLLAFVLGSISNEIGTAEFIISLAKGIVAPAIVPALMFLVACVISFATGTANGAQAIVIPLAVPIAYSLGAPVIITIAAAACGGLFGDHCSPISDTTILSSMGSSCDNIAHFVTQLPYAVTAAGITFITYLLTAFIQNVFVLLLIAIVLLIMSHQILFKIWGGQHEQEN